MKKLLPGLILLLLCTRENSFSQAGAGVKLGPKRQAYVDSIKNSNYKWMFPIWGKKVAKKGFDIPYPVGIMLNSYGGSQQIRITDLQVGFNDSKLVPLDFIKFGEVKANLQSVTVRPDLWIFPFLDVYAIGGATWSQTEVKVTDPMEFKTTADFNGSTFGLGTTFAGGFHGILGILDYNHTWSSIAEIEGTIQANMVSARFGYNFLFERPDRSLAAWVGPMGLFINRTTVGSINLGDLESNASKSDLEGAANETASWYQDLTPAQKQVIKAIAQKLIDKIDGNGGDLIVNYSLNKKPTSNWSMVVGAQFQFNHNWQVRTEAGFLGGRKSILLSANYRFRW